MANWLIGELRTLVFYNLIHQKEGLSQTFAELILGIEKIKKIFFQRPPSIQIKRERRNDGEHNH